MRLLITGAWKYTAEQLVKVEQLGYSIIEMPDERGNLPCDPKDIDAVICNGLFLYHDIEQFSNLRFIQLTSAGFDRIPIEYVKEKGIKIFNACGVYSIPMAEFVIHSALLIYKERDFFRENQKLCRWEKHRGLRELNGKTVLIVGCGNVGIEVAKRFSAFGCRVIGVDKELAMREYIEEIFSTERLNLALAEADIVVSCVALNEQTFHLFDTTVFGAMRENSLFINVSRGAVVDTSALLEASRNKGIIAVLDVFEQEPLDWQSELWSCENILITPHNSFVGDGNGDRLWNIIKNNLELNRY